MFRIVPIKAISINPYSLIRHFRSDVKFKEKQNEPCQQDVFGSLSESGQKRLTIHSTEKFLPEDHDGYDREEIDLAPRKNAYYYKYEISKYARQGKLGIKKALELFHHMKSKDRLTPDLTSFSPLIYGCAKAGYTKKAFELYEESLRYHPKPTKSTVTCLINACSESPFPDYGIARLKWLKEHLKYDFNYNYNLLQYNCLVKAHGKLGQLSEASKVVQEMLNEGVLPDSRTFNMLLIGCASNEKAGATLALRVFKRMKLYEIPRDIYTYRLMLKCIRDCGMGSSELLKETLGELPAMTSFEQKLRYKRQLNKKTRTNADNFEWLPLLTELGRSIEVALEPELAPSAEMKLLPDGNQDHIEVSDLRTEDRFSLVTREPATYSLQSLPSLLSENHLDLIDRIQAIRFDRMNSSSSRLILFGGMHGFLETMERDGSKPDNKTFSLILECMKKTKENQLEYFRLSKDYSIKRDLLFYDLLIRNITNSKDADRLDRALYFVEQLHKDGLRPNITTFESLSFGCDTNQQAKQLVSDLENCGFVVSDPLIKGFFVAALRRYDFSYLIWVLKLSSEKGFTPDKSLIERLEETRLAARSDILKFEKSRFNTCDKPEWLHDETQIKRFDQFNKSLGAWLKSVEVYEEEHPWSQFYVKSKSRKEGFHNFVQSFKTLIETKNEALRRKSNAAEQN